MNHISAQSTGLRPQICELEMTFFMRLSLAGDRDNEWYEKTLKGVAVAKCFQKRRDFSTMNVQGDPLRYPKWIEEQVCDTGGEVSPPSRLV